MGTILKALGKGLLYVLLFPLLVAAVSLYGVFGIFVFLFTFGKMIYLFFTGRSLSSDLEEDIKVKAIIAKKNGEEEEKEEEKESPMSLYPSDSIVYANPYSPTTVKEENKEEIEQDKVESLDDIFVEPKEGVDD